MRAVPSGAMDEQPADQLEEHGPEPEQKPASRAGWIWATVVVLALAALIGYVSIKANEGAEPTPARASTCGEWAAKGGANKVIQAREMLTAFRRQDGLGAPETAVAQQFADGLTGVCGSSQDGSRLSEIAAGLYITRRDTFG